MVDTIKITHDYYDLDLEGVGAYTGVLSHPGDYLVETAGYLSKQDQMARITASGRALDAYYKSIAPGYVHPDSQDDIDPDYDPTSDPGYEYFDYHNDMVYVKNTLRSQREQLLRQSVMPRPTTPSVSQGDSPADNTRDDNATPPADPPRI